MDNYLLVASAQIKSQGGSAHRIESVLFIATSGITSRKWMVQNTGALALDLACLVDAGSAARILHRLSEGQPVLFNETFAIEQLEAWMDARGKSI
jgi:hypothetical protein